MQQPYGMGPGTPMQLQTVRRTYRSAEGYRRDAAAMQAAGFLPTRHDARGVTWERLVPWGTNPPVPPQPRERTPELWILAGVFGALLVLMLLLVVASNAGNYTLDDSPTAVIPSSTPGRPSVTAAGSARAIPTTPPPGVVPQLAVAPTANPAFLPPSVTAGPVITAIPIASPGASPAPASPPATASARPSAQEVSPTG